MHELVALLIRSAPALQVGGEVDPTVRTLLTGYEFVGALLGFFIAYQAYRGYRRNDSRPMLFIALGFVLIFAGGTVAFLLLGLLPAVPAAVLGAANQTVEIAGLLCIIYALRVPSE